MVATRTKVLALSALAAGISMSAFILNDRAHSYSVEQAIRTERAFASAADKCSAARKAANAWARAYRDASIVMNSGTLARDKRKETDWTRTAQTVCDWRG